MTPYIIIGLYLIFIFLAYGERVKYKLLKKELERKKQEKEQNIVIFQMDDFSHTTNMSNKEVEDLKDYFKKYNTFYNVRFETENVIEYQHLDNKGNRITIYYQNRSK